jgi:hypothetical protein
MFDLGLIVIVVRKRVVKVDLLIAQTEHSVNKSRVLTH